MHHKSRRSSQPTRSLAVALVCVLTLALTGCLSGSEWVTSFSQEFSNDPAVESLDLSTADNMPFTGGVGGTVYLRNDLDDAETRAVSEKVREFGEQIESKPDDPRFRITLDGDGWRFPVLADAQSNAALLDVLFAYRADPQLQSGAFSSTDYRQKIDHVSLVTTSTTDTFALITDTATELSKIGQHPGFTVKGPNDPSGSVSLAGRPGAWVQSAEHVYEQLRAAVPLTSFQAEESAFTVKVREEADAATAAEIASSALGGESIDVFVQSELVTLAPGAHGVAAREVLASLDESARAHIVDVWTDDASASFRLASSAQAAAIAETLTRAPEASGFASIELADGTLDDSSFRVQSTPGDLASLTQHAAGVLGHPNVEAVRVNQRHSIDLVLASTPPDGDLESLARELKPLSTVDERLCVEWPKEGFCFFTAPVADLAEIKNPTAQQRVFLDAWNAAN